YKGVSDEGLYRNFAEVIERVGDARLRLYLYHIPPVSQVPVTLALIERLLKNFPGTVAGVKDSSGDWSNTKAMLDAFAKSGFDVFAGSEVFLLENMRAGGVGCITATGNINPGAINKVFENWRGPRVRGKRGLPAREHAGRRRGLHHGDGQHQPGSHQQGLRELARPER